MKSLSFLFFFLLFFSRSRKVCFVLKEGGFLSILHRERRHSLPNLFSSSSSSSSSLAPPPLRLLSPPFLVIQRERAVPTFVEARQRAGLFVERRLERAGKVPRDERVEPCLHRVVLLGFDHPGGEFGGRMRRGGTHLCSRSSSRRRRRRRLRRRRRRRRRASLPCSFFFSFRPLRHFVQVPEPPDAGGAVRDLLRIDKILGVFLEFLRREGLEERSSWSEE